MSEPFGFPKSEVNRTTKLYKKAKQNSSELEESRRLPTARFGVSETRDRIICKQVIDSQPEFRDCIACTPQAQEMKRKLNPFVEGNAPAIPERVPKGTFRKPLFLDTFVALIMSPSNNILEPQLNKKRYHT